MEQVALWSGFVASILAVIGHGFYARHQRYRLLARFARKWEEQAIDYAESMRRLDHLSGEPEEMRRIIAMWRRHDEENFQLCSKEARYWRAQLPPRRRERYLADAA